MRYTIQDLRKGRVVVINDGTLQDLKEVLSKAEGKPTLYPGGSKYYWNTCNYFWNNKNSYPKGLPTQSVKDFLLEEINYEVY